LAVAFAALEKEPLLANRLQRYEDVEKNMFPLLLSAKFQTGKMMCVFFDRNRRERKYPCYYNIMPATTFSIIPYLRVT
jgi:hypothetical protein